MRDRKKGKEFSKKEDGGKRGRGKEGNVRRKVMRSVGSG